MSTSLQDLRDIVEPDAVSWWPPAIGWWIVASAGVMTGAWILWMSMRRWQANAYRRAALIELKDANSDAEIAALIKRTAMCVYPRREIAPLTGPQWVDWLEKHGGVAVPNSMTRLLSEGVFADRTETVAEELRQFADAWIRLHREPERC